jgi:hypothetical protein
MAGKAYAAFAQDKNRKAQKGVGAGGADQLLPSTSCHDYSTTKYGEEEVYVAYIVRAYDCDQIPTVT